MRPIPSFFAALISLAALAACGTKTPLSLPPQAPPATTVLVPAAPENKSATTEPSREGLPLRSAPAVDNSNKATEPRQ